MLDSYYHSDNVIKLMLIIRYLLAQVQINCTFSNNFMSHLTLKILINSNIFLVLICLFQYDDNLFLYKKFIDDQVQEIK